MDQNAVLSRRLAVRQHIRTFPEWTSTQGIPQFSFAKRRICCTFWLVSTLIAVGLLIYQMVLVFQQYYQRAVSVNIEVQLVMDTYKYSAYKLVCGWSDSCDYTTNETLEDLASTYQFAKINNTGQLRQMATSLMYLAAAEYNMSETMTTKSELIVGCSFNTASCAESDWSALSDPYLGNCFQFNMDKSRTAERAGPSYGLRLELRTNVSEYVPVVNGAALVLLVSDQDEDVVPGMVGYYVATGARTGVTVTYTTTSRLGRPYGDCSDQRPPGYLYNGTYSTEMCQRSDFQYMMVDACDCYDPSYPTPANSSVAACAIDTDLSCWLEYNNHTAGLECRQPCTQGSYTVTTSSGAWPTPLAAYVAGCAPGQYADSCNREYAMNAAIVDVYYEKLNYESLTESPATTVSDTLSSLGGQIGLWLGMSLVSVVEFFVLMVQVCVSCVSPKRAYYVDF